MTLIGKSSAKGADDDDDAMIAFKQDSQVWQRKICLMFIVWLAELQKKIIKKSLKCLKLLRGHEIRKKANFNLYSWIAIHLSDKLSRI